MPGPAALAGQVNGAKSDGRRARTEGRSPALERVTVNLTSRSARALELVTGLTGDSKTDAINRAIQVLSLIHI